MDIGQLKNPFGSNDPKKATGSSGPFKIGDYDNAAEQNNSTQSSAPTNQSNTQAQQNSQAKRESTATSLKEGVQSTLDKLSGQRVVIIGAVDFDQLHIEYKRGSHLE
ncbi:hypothetical protein PHYBLDRAFT_144394 [Phycomyces blakesleeanus NRRL 1555(-)]|uniref:Uncharacterized protein n=1 Tax=Phycomyces blakesleeanus (strain ATCC 8743b / DSM 1359 / FGSC 10004 / NBRC 33097 / NRRL 1555) TaxID=763407 RepID=A0A163AQ71_PHYB8|nr:hypothetical protein PHYBLDRAFT_144394 [Phycomyces blakesleeanus NRRL 1555(-)]OAD75041.1 hypothetical protein PHYBLDRAFT_144394 [Phycomyces blakesleeanus NRRL 1555(-)]|eukprot:XP_018293081.1 hypothetical protein PHYBLDRAFT_144394 [Phycomyces blakesleeanus NRRL 1555(-)]